MTSLRKAWMALPLLALGLGCGSMGAKSFRALDSPEAIVRARAVALGEHLPREKVVPALIERLNDADAVVRLSAHEELRHLTGQDFGYLPWGDAGERASAVERWRSWWKGQPRLPEDGLAKSARKS